MVRSLDNRLNTPRRPGLTRLSPNPKTPFFQMGISWIKKLNRWGFYTHADPTSFHTIYSFVLSPSPPPPVSLLAWREKRPVLSLSVTENFVIVSSLA